MIASTYTLSCDRMLKAFRRSDIDGVTMIPPARIIAAILKPSYARRGVGVFGDKKIESSESYAVCHA